MRFSSKAPGEIKTLTFDFTEDLQIKNASGAVIGANAIVPGSAAVAVAVAKGVDADPNQLKNGAPQISGSLVLQSAKVGIDGNDYEFNVGVDDNTGQHHIITWILPIRRGA